MNTNNGWIKIHRELIDKPIWVKSTSQQKAILITLLLMVNHEERKWEWKGKPYTCKPGQVITSLNDIAKRAGNDITIMNVRTSLKRFEALGFLENLSTKQNRLITICKWDSYQENKNEPNNALTIDLEETDIKKCKNDENSTNDLTKQEDSITDYKINDYELPQTETNKAPNNQLTKPQQCTNSRLTTNKKIRMKEDIYYYDDVYYAHEAFKNRQWVESVCMKHHFNQDELKKYFNDFVLSCRTLNRKHEDLQDFQSNFVYWLDIKIQKQHEKQKIDEQIAKRFQNRRSRYETTSTSWQDYEGKF